MFCFDLIKFIVLIVVVQFSNLVHAQYYGSDDWMDMGRDTNDKYQMYLNKSALKFVDAEFYATFKSEYKSEQKSKQGISYTTVVANNIIDCKNDSFILLKTELINSSGKVIDTFSISREFAQWKKIPSGSFLGMTSNKYCSQALDAYNSNSRKPSQGQIPTSGEKINGSNQKCVALGFKEGSSAFDRCLSQLNN
jgi:hypothetical protein